MTKAYIPSDIMRYFSYQHLPQHLRDVSAPICEIAENYDKTLPPGPEKSTALRKLLEAKDCVVRAALPPVTAAAVDQPQSNSPAAANTPDPAKVAA